MILALLITFFLLSIAAIYPFYSKKGILAALSGWGIVFFLIAVCKDGHILWDYESYLNLFENYDVVLIELTFYWISSFIHTYLGGESFFLFVIYAILGISLKLTAIYRMSNFVFLSLLIYFSHFFIAQELIQIRAGVAAGFFLLSLKPLYDKNFLKYLICISLGTLFHTSLLLVLFLWFLNPKSINKLFYVSILLISYVIGLFKIEYFTLLFKIVTLGRFQQQYAGYMEIADMLDPVSVFSFQQLLKLGCVGLILFKMDLIVPHCKYIYLFLKIMIISLAVVPLLHENAVIALRVRDVFGVIEIFLFPLLAYLFVNRRIGYILCCGLALLLFVVSYLEMSPDHALRQLGL